MRRVVIGSFVLVALAAFSRPDVAAAVERLDPPAAPQAFAPYLAVARDGGAAATWIEPAGGDSAAGRIRFARFAAGAWSEATTVAASEALFANWADTPGVVEAGDGRWIAWWLEKLGGETYAYGIRLARSSDGKTWEPLGWLQDDTSATEHGFVSAVAAGTGARFAWLDGRATGGGHDHGGGGAMQLRTTTVDAAIAPSTLVDASVCDCCPTAAVAAPAGPLVVYRDRTAEEIRDIRVAHLATAATAPVAAAPTHPPEAHSVPVAGDGWKIEGCPVNGPALARAGERIAVAWFTGAQERGRVQFASSSDGGAAFGAPVTIDERAPLGRVSLAGLDGDAVAVGWLARAGESAEFRVVRVPSQGAAGTPLVLATTSAGRKSGVPRLVRLADGAVLALWTEAGESGTKLAGARLAPGELGGR